MFSASHLIDNRREFTIHNVEQCGLLNEWPKSDRIPFVKILEDIDIGFDL